MAKIGWMCKAASGAEPVGAKFLYVHVSTEMTSP
jgi:hypothetical protein